MTVSAHVLGRSVVGVLGEFFYIALCLLKTRNK
jgi:hypothetical protein